MSSSDLSPAHAHTYSNGNSGWAVVGDGKQDPDCRRPVPVAVHQGAGVVVWGPHSCTRRACPACIDSGYVQWTTNRQLHELQANLSQLTYQKRMREKVPIVKYDKEVQEFVYYGDQWRRLKVYHAIISLQEEDSVSSYEEYENKRKQAIKIAKSQGFIWGFLTAHPYRGEKGRSGKERRSHLNRDQQSLHFHVIGLGYWIMEHTDGRYGNWILKVPKGDKNKERPSGILGTIGKTAQEVSILWGRLKRVLVYELDHSGYYMGSQITTRFGSRIHTDPQDERPEPLGIIMIRDNKPPRPDEVCVEIARRLLMDRRTDATICWILERMRSKNGFLCMGAFDEDLRFRWYHIDDPVIEQYVDDTKGIQWDQELVSRMGKYNKIPAS